MPFKVGITLEGDKALRDAFSTLKRSLQKKHLRKAMNAAGKQLLWAVRGRTPKRTGLLYKSLGRKVKTYKSGIVVAIVGARVGFRKPVGVRQKPGVVRGVPRKAGEPIFADPTKYLHLVEGGHSGGAQPKRILAGSLQALGPEVVKLVEAAMQAAIAEAAQKGGR
jgi:hypothetical protein